jgi:hypothetical protein
MERDHPENDNSSAFSKLCACFPEAAVAEIARLTRLPLSARQINHRARRARRIRHFEFERAKISMGSRSTPRSVAFRLTCRVRDEMKTISGASRLCETAWRLEQ